MLAIFSLIFSTLLVVLGVWLLNNIRVGFATGKLAHTDTASVAVKSKEPVKYWFIMLIQLVLAVPFTVMAVSMFVKTVAALFWWGS